MGINLYEKRLESYGRKEQGRTEKETLCKGLARSYTEAGLRCFCRHTASAWTDVYEAMQHAGGLKGRTRIAQIVVEE